MASFCCRPETIAAEINDFGEVVTAFVRDGTLTNSENAAAPTGRSVRWPRRSSAGAFIALSRDSNLVDTNEPGRHRGRQFPRLEFEKE